MIRILTQYPDAELVAVCDKSKPVTERCRSMVQKVGKKVAFYSSFDKFMNHEMDGVIVANYATEHVPYVVQLLDAGFHVSCEVPACQTMAEAVELVEAVQRNKKVYAFMANAAYTPLTFEMRRRYEKGDIGEFLHGEAEYHHDLGSKWPMYTGGSPDHWRNWIPATFYCTHSMGPLVLATGTRPIQVSAYETQNIIKRTYGSRGADGSLVVCQMDNGAVVKLLPWTVYGSRLGHWYCMYGSKGMMENGRGDDASQLTVYVQRGRKRPSCETYAPEAPAMKHIKSFEAGHGGSDLYNMYYFIEAIRGRIEGRKHGVDVFQALDFTLPGLLGYRSIYEGNIPIEIPDLRKKKERDKYRDDHWCIDPHKAGPGQPKGSCREDRAGKIRIPDSLYKKQKAEVKKRWKEIPKGE